MADLHRGNPSFVINPGNPWGPNNSVGPLGGRNPNQGPVQAHEFRDPSDGPPPWDGWHPHSDPREAPWRDENRPFTETLDELGDYFAGGSGGGVGGQGGGPVIHPLPWVDAKRRIFSIERWKKDVENLFSMYGRPSVAETDALKACTLLPSEWIRKAMRRARKKLVQELKDAFDAQDEMPVGTDEDYERSVSVIDQARQRLADLDAMVSVVIRMTQNLEDSLGAAPDNR